MFIHYNQVTRLPILKIELAGKMVRVVGEVWVLPATVTCKTFPACISYSAAVSCSTLSLNTEGSNRRDVYLLYTYNMEPGATA